MAINIFTLMGTILVDNNKANDSIDKTSKKTDTLTDKMVKGADKVAKLVDGAIVAGGALVTAFAVKGVKSAVEFQSEMSNVATLLDGDVNKRVEELGNAVKDVAIKTGTSTSLLTDGLYQVISAVGDSADSMAILETASKGARAGNSTVTDSVNLLSAVMKGYGDVSAESAQKASDLAFKTVKLGQTSFPELASSMGKVIPLASTMKVSQEELFGAMATLTGVTGGTAEVTTQLRGAIQGFMDPSKEMEKQIQALGYESGQMMIENLGLQGSLDTLKDSVGGNEIAFAGLFGSVEAKNAVLALTGNQAEDFTAKTNQMKDAVGATDDAFAKQTDNVKANWESLKNNAEIVGMSLGEKLLPKLSDFLNWINEKMPLIEEIATKTFDVFSESIEWVTQNSDWLIPVLAGVLGGILALAAVSKVMALFKAWKTITEGVTTVQGLLNAVMMANPAAIVAIGIGALIAIGILLWKNWDTVKEKMSVIFKSISSVASSVFGGITGSIKGMINGAISGLNTLISGLNRVKFDIPKWVPVLGGKTFGISIPLLPQFAKGTDYFKPDSFWGNTALVGEQGPELVNLPRGSQVITADKTERKLNEKKTLTCNIFMDSRLIAKGVAEYEGEEVANFNVKNGFGGVFG